ncbi:MAG: hypothetical protein AMK69_16370 [Nitrospira bacterium SG8_3]|nr:MAG: hypothetical protein AMK69_16370 [Nitrospira bacterium SG8_3]
MTLSRIQHGITILWMGCVVLFLCQVGSARGAQLRYIRIGEHEGFTRIVFEFRGSAVFEKPQVKGKGELSVVFLDTTTALPRQILSETTKRVNAIEFVQQDAHLAAHITFLFPYFRLKPFTLSNPERIVLDVYQTSAPPKDPVVVESVQRPPERVLAETAKEKEMANSTKKITEQAVKPLEAPDRPADKPSAPEAQRDSQRPLQETAIRSTALPEEPTSAVAESPKPGPDTESASVNRSLQQSPWQTYPLAILIILSIVIVALLSFIIFQKRWGPGSRYIGGTLEATFEAGESMAAIDKRIKDAFKQFDES